jgi:hypothetical protein
MDRVTFESDVRPLFRSEDRENMEWAFDLWSYDDVVAAAEDILERIADGTMPCDLAWGEPMIDTFRAWIAGGCQR